MKLGQKLLPIFLMLALLILTAGQPAEAMTFSAKDRFMLAQNDTIPDDLYLTCAGAEFHFGTEAKAPGGAFIDGVILGDMCLAGGSYSFTGFVQDNLNSASQRATVRGIIGHSARIAAQLVTLDGEIGRDAVVFASEVELGSSSVIKQDAAIMGGKVSINGSIGRNAYIRSDQVILSGYIGGNLDIEATSITIEAPAEILGNINYTSPHEITIDDDVIVHGDIEWEKTETPEETEQDSDIGFYVILFFCSLTTGLILIPLFKQHTLLSVDQLKKHPLPSLGIGFVFLFAAPFAIILLLITIIGIPASIILLFAYTIFFYIAKIYTSIVVGDLIINAFRKNTKNRPAVSFVIGLIILSILFRLPVIGWPAWIFTIFFGMGALLRGMHQCRMKITQPSELSEPEQTTPG